MAAALLAQLVERAGVDHDDVRREPRGVLEDPQPAAVVAVEHDLRRAVAEDRPLGRRADLEPVHRLEVGLVEAGPGPPGAVRLERRPDVDELVLRVDAAQDRVPRTRLGLHRGDDQHVLGRERRERQPSGRVRRHVELHVVEPGRDHLADDVDERRRARCPAPEGDRRRRQPALAVLELAHVDGDVVALDLDQRGTLARLLLGQAGGRGIGHGPDGNLRGVGDETADVAESWPVESSEDLYRSSLPFALRADRIRHPDGPGEEPFTRVVLEHPGAVVVLAVDDEERVFCLRQYRHPARMRMLELPAGLAGRRGGGAPGRRRARAARGGRARGERMGAVGVGVQLARHHHRADPLLPGSWAPRGRSGRLHARPRGGRHGRPCGCRTPSCWPPAWTVGCATPRC